MTIADSVDASLVWAQVWQVSSTILVVGFVTKRLLSSRPHLSHALWFVVLAKCLTPPIWASSLGVFCWSGDESRQVAESRTDQAATLDAPSEASAPQPRSMDSDARTSVTATDEEFVARSSSDLRESGRLTTFNVEPRSSWSWPRLLVLAWLVGACVFIATAFVRRVITNYTLRRMSIREADDFQGFASRLKQKLGLRWSGAIYWSTREIGPAVFGILRPVVVLPQSLKQCSESELEPMLAHELIHIRRRDGLVALLQELVQAIWWFHPLVWWANRQIVATREQCCDEETVVAIGCDAGQYAQLLLNVAKGKRYGNWLRPAIAMAASAVTRKRLEHIMLRNERFNARTPLLSWLLAGLFAVAILPGAARSLAQRADKASESTRQAAHIFNGQRNRVADDAILPESWDLATGKNIRWVQDLGAKLVGSPVISGDRIYLQLIHVQLLGKQTRPKTAGSLICLDRATGKRLWNYDSPEAPRSLTKLMHVYGVASQPLVVGNGIYYVTPAAEVVCLDARTGSNEKAPDVLWSVDLIRQCEVVPYYGVSVCRPVLVNDLVLLTTCHDSGKESSGGASFLAIDRRLGTVVWQDDSPGAGIIHGNWSSPTVAEIDGVTQAIFPGGDAWLYAFDVAEIAKGKAEPLWRFDCNPKGSQWHLGGKGTRNSTVTTPVVVGNRVFVAVGQNPEHGEGNGHLWCIDAGRRGDLSPEILDREPPEITKTKVALARLAARYAHNSEQLNEMETALKNAVARLRIANPNSGVVWHLSESKQFEATIHRAIGSPSVASGIVVFADFSGIIHAVRAGDGRRLWSYDAFAMTYAQPSIVGDRVYAADEDGEIAVLNLKTGEPLAELNCGESIYSSPVVHGNTLYVPTRTKLIAIGK